MQLHVYSEAEAGLQQAHMCMHARTCAQPADHAVYLPAAADMVQADKLLCSQDGDLVLIFDAYAKVLVVKRFEEEGAADTGRWRLLRSGGSEARSGGACSTRPGPGPSGLACMYGLRPCGPFLDPRQRAMLASQAGRPNASTHQANLLHVGRL